MNIATENEVEDDDEDDGGDEDGLNNILNGFGDWLRWTAYVL